MKSLDCGKSCLNQLSEHGRRATPDQAIEAAKAWALLAIAEQLERIADVKERRP